MAWIPLVPVMLAASVLLLAPGAALARALGIRGVALLIVSPGLSITLTGTLALLYAPLGVRWTPASFLVGVAVVTAAGWGSRRLIQRRSGPISLRLVGFHAGSFAAGLLLWATITMATMARLFRQPWAIIQSYDNVFHLNAVQYILDSGSASSLTLTTFTSGGALPTPYPAAWHGFASLVLEVARSAAPSTPIGSAVNAATLAVLILGWAAGCLLLAHTLTDGSLGVSVLTVAALAGVFAFPWAFLPEGGLYPNLLGNSLLPSAIALLFLIARRTQTHVATGDGVQLEGEHSLLSAVAAMALLVPGIALAHPNSAFTLLIVAVAVAWQSWLQAWPRDRERSSRFGLGLAALVAASLAVAVAWVRFAPARPTPASPPTNLADSLWHLVQGVLSPAALPAPSLTILVAIGLIGALRRGWIAAAISTAVATVVFLVSFGGPTVELSTAAGGLLYNDTKRIAAFAVMCALPLLVHAVSMVDAWLRHLFARTDAGTADPRYRLGLLVMAVVLFFPLQLWSLYPKIDQASKHLVVLSEKTRRMNLPEYRLISRMPSLVPVGERVIANPGAGGGYIYSLTGVPLVFAHSFVNDSPAMHQLRTSMFDPSTLAKTCAAMDQLHAHFYYHSDRTIVVPKHGPDSFPALDKPRMSMLTLVAADGPAKLYRFTACTS